MTLVGTDDPMVKFDIEDAYQPPAWAITPDQQLKRASRLWAGVRLPAPLVGFEPATPTEVPLLYVPDTFMQLYSRIPGDYKHFWRGLGLPSSRFARPNKSALLSTEAVWLGFDPMFGLCQSPATLWEGDTQLASLEVLSAMVMFPQWMNTWPDDAAPWMAGYSIGPESNLRVPKFWLSKANEALVLRSCGANELNPSWASPSVRVL